MLSMPSRPAVTTAQTLEPRHPPSCLHSVFRPPRTPSFTLSRLSSTAPLLRPPSCVSLSIPLYSAPPAPWLHPRRLDGPARHGPPGRERLPEATPLPPPSLYTVSVAAAMVLMAPVLAKTSANSRAGTPSALSRSPPSPSPALPSTRQLLRTTSSLRHEACCCVQRCPPRQPIP